MFLIDTSIWIDFFRERKTSAIDYFENIIEQKIPFGLTNIIYQEILQGAASERDFEQLRDYLGSQRFYHPRDDIHTYAQAAKIYLACRKKGITIRSTIDCLIAQIAIEYDLTLLHCDKDYDQIKKVVSKLRLANHHH